MQLFDSETLLYKSQIQELKKYSNYISILIAEDYKELQTSLKNLFSLFFTKIDVTNDGKEAFELYEKNFITLSSYDIVFSDIVMPNMNGIELAKKVKSLNPKQNIIIFSSYQDTDYLLEFINIGIKRFVPKPILLKPLLDMLISICKDIDKEKKLSNKFIISKNLYYLMLEKELFAGEQPVKLSGQEVQVLEFLISKSNKTVSTEEIISFLYSKSIDIKPENVRKMIYKLRKKLPDDVLETVHGVGYKLIVYNN